jgi:tetratricopeptide (TPR) repeat protein
MIFTWLKANEAAKLGAALADQYASKQVIGSATSGDHPGSHHSGDAMREILNRVDREVRSLQLNFYKKAKFANSFKWKLLENGVEKTLADEMTQTLVLHLARNPSESEPSANSDAPTTDRPRSNDPKSLLSQGNKSMARHDYAGAVAFYHELITLNPRHLVALNNLGAALFKLARIKEAEGCFQQLIRLDPGSADGHSNLGNTYLATGLYADAETFLRRALKLNPRHVEARITLGSVLSHLNRLREARSQFDKALKYEPRNEDALVGMAFVFQMEGDFDQAGTMLSRALQVNPQMPKALASHASMRKMTTSDSAWLKNAEQAADSGIALMDKSELRFAMGKYFDDIGDFEPAFQNYKRANELLKPIAKPYDREIYRGFVDNMIDVYTPEVLARLRDGASSSMLPVLIVGMPRSGTSLTEQIVASHPLARGAGELAFWGTAVQENEGTIKSVPLSESTRQKLAETYLEVLKHNSGDAIRIVDKAPVNSDYLGIIHSVLPNARIIYMQRDPIDTCLSCYFQKFVLSMNFTFDLADLADHYREHARLMAHWRATLPPGTILDVPYEELVADQRGWSRKILEFIGLEWDERVLDFPATQRAVVTASFWQVRQKMYNNSVHRWANYKKFIGPLLDLKVR